MHSGSQFQGFYAFNANFMKIPKPRTATICEIRSAIVGVARSRPCFPQFTAIFHFLVCAFVAFWAVERERERKTASLDLRKLSRGTFEQKKKKKSPEEQNDARGNKNFKTASSVRVTNFRTNVQISVFFSAFLFLNFYFCIFFSGRKLDVGAYQVTGENVATGEKLFAFLNDWKFEKRDVHLPRQVISSPHGSNHLLAPRHVKQFIK